jgi:hypothetical protein
LRSYDVPLTAAEEAELNRRSAALEELAPILQDYAAAHPEEYAGMFVDQAQGGRLVMLFTGHLEGHAAAIGAVVRPGSVEVRQGLTSEAELNALMERVIGDMELRELGVFVLTTSGDESMGVVEIGVSSARDDAEAVLVGRFGPAIRVEILDPTGAFLLPPGTIIGRVVDEHGRGMAADLADSPLFGAFPQDLGGHASNADGSFRFDRQLPGRWRITASADGFVPASIVVDVPSAGIATVEIVLTRP